MSWLPKVTQLGSGSWLSNAVCDLSRLLRIGFPPWLSDVDVGRSSQHNVETCWSSRPCVEGFGGSPVRALSQPSEQCLRSAAVGLTLLSAPVGAGSEQHTVCIL